MNKKSIGILIIVIVAILGVSISMNSEEKNDNVVFHITLADPELYTNVFILINFRLIQEHIFLDLSQMEVVLKFYQ